MNKITSSLDLMTGEELACLSSAGLIGGSSDSLARLRRLDLHFLPPRELTDVLQSLDVVESFMRQESLYVYRTRVGNASGTTILCRRGDYLYFVAGTQNLLPFSVEACVAYLSDREIKQAYTTTSFPSDIRAALCSSLTEKIAALTENDHALFAAAGITLLSYD